MGTQTLIISNLPANCDEAWLRHEAKHPERIVSVTVMRPDDMDRHGVTLVVELAGDRSYVDNLVSRFHGKTIGGREVRLYAPIFGG
jgi:hypothetical protein